MYICTVYLEARMFACLIISLGPIAILPAITIEIMYYKTSLVWLKLIDVLKHRKRFKYIVFHRCALQPLSSRNIQRRTASYSSLSRMQWFTFSHTFLVFRMFACLTISLGACCSIICNYHCGHHEHKTIG